MLFVVPQRAYTYRIAILRYITLARQPTFAANIRNEMLFAGLQLPCHFKNVSIIRPNEFATFHIQYMNSRIVTVCTFCVLRKYDWRIINYLRALQILANE